MQEVRERILYRHKEDGYDWLREAYNDIIIESRIVEGRQGICQEKFITITVVRKDYEAARAYLSSLESSFINNFAALSSAMIPLDANERIRILDSFIIWGMNQNMTIRWKKHCYRDMDLKDELACSVMDFDSYIDRFYMDDKVGSILYLDRNRIRHHYPTHF